MNDTDATDDQRAFIDNCKRFQHYDQERNFVVDFDQVYHWIGFARKASAKRLLLKYFDEGTDYAISHRPANGREVIMLTPAAYKHFCMQADTPRAKEIRRYYRKLETIFFRAAAAAIQGNAARETAFRTRA